MYAPRTQLLSGSSQKQLADRFLSGGAADQALLKGGVVSAAGIDDVKEWREMCAAMGELGFTDQEQSALLDALAALLHLGNCTFAGSTKAPDSIREEEEGDHVGELQQADVEAEGGRAEKFERARTYTGML